MTFSDELQSQVYTVMFEALPENLTEKQIRMNLRLKYPDTPRLGPGTLGLLLYWWWSMGRVRVVDPEQKPLLWTLIPADEVHLRDIERMYCEIELTQQLKTQRVSENENRRYMRLLESVDRWLIALDDCLASIPP